MHAVRSHSNKRPRRLFALPIVHDLPNEFSKKLVWPALTGTVPAIWTASVCIEFLYDQLTTNDSLIEMENGANNGEKKHSGDDPAILSSEMAIEVRLKKSNSKMSVHNNTTNTRRIGHAIWRVIHNLYACTHADIYRHIYNMRQRERARDESMCVVYHGTIGVFVAQEMVSDFIYSPIYCSDCCPTNEWMLFVIVHCGGGQGGDGANEPGTWHRSKILAAYCSHKKLMHEWWSELRCFVN